MTGHCSFILVVLASQISLSRAKPTHLESEEQDLFSQSVEHTLKSFGERSALTKGSLTETKLQSLKTDVTRSETSLRALSARSSQSRLDDQTLSSVENLANHLSRKILLDWSAGGRKLSSFVPIQLKTVKGEKISHASLIRVVRSRIFKTKNWKKFGRVALDQLGVRLMKKKATQVKNKAWKKFGRNGLTDLTTRLMKKKASSPMKSKGWKKFGRVGLDELTLRLMKKSSGLKNKDWKKFGRLGLDQLAMRLMR